MPRKMSLLTFLIQGFYTKNLVSNEFWWYFIDLTFLLEGATSPASPKCCAVCRVWGSSGSFQSKAVKIRVKVFVTHVTIFNSLFSSSTVEEEI
jgi:hypothetical protein